MLREWFDKKEKEDLKFWSKFNSKKISFLIQPPVSIFREMAIVGSLEAGIEIGRKFNKTTSICRNSLYYLFSGEEQDVLNNLKKEFGE